MCASIVIVIHTSGGGRDKKKLTHPSSKFLNCYKGIPALLYPQCHVPNSLSIHTMSQSQVIPDQLSRHYSTFEVLHCMITLTGLLGKGYARRRCQRHMLFNENLMSALLSPTGVILKISINIVDMQSALQVPVHLSNFLNLSISTPPPMHPMGVYLLFSSLCI